MIDREKPIYVQVEQWLEACYNPDNTMSTPEKLTHAYRLLSHFKNQNDAKVPVETTMNDKVKLSEIVEALRHVGCASGLDVRHALANRIEAHGIEQPSIDALIAEAVSDQPPFMRGKYRKQFEASVKEAIEEKPVSEANDLIKRIDDALEQFGISTYEWDLLADCRAEIELLTQSNQCLRDQNTYLDEKLAEYSERKYVPMTDEQVGTLTVFDGLHHVETPILAEYIRHIEQAVIKRAGLEVKHD